MLSNYPDDETDAAKIDSCKYDGVLIGENEQGCVYMHGPYGNKDSDVKIAYLIGMHPFESKSHRALFERVVELSDDLKYCYFIYNISVYGTLGDDEGRMKGQLLARDFVYPDVVENNYDFFVDVHSNRGLRGPGGYAKCNFIFAPAFDDESVKRVDEILSKMDDIEYYVPKYRTSPKYITEPVAQSGIATIVYETYTYEPFEKTMYLAGKLVMNIDDLEFK